MLSKRMRLPVGDFKKAQTKIIQTDFFSVKYLKNNFDYNRFGVTISSKAEPKSVMRHFVKRRVFEKARLLPSFGKDFLFILKSGKRIEKKSFPEAINSTFTKIKNDLSL